MRNLVSTCNGEINKSKCPAEESSTLVLKPEERVIEMLFYLKHQDGNYETRAKNLFPGQSLFICFTGFKGVVSHSSVPDTGFMKLHIRFNVTFLEAVTGQDCPQTMRLLKQISTEKFIDSRQRIHSISPQMRMIIAELLSCDKSGTVKRLYWQSRILELLMLQIEQIEGAGRPLNSIKYYDVEKLWEAKSIVENNLISPYPLKTLAHKVGLNDFKLKRGFKELFGYTVFGYLRELRMQEARKLLLIRKDSVTEVSGEVGYQHPHHFSAAFKKRFGVLPGVLNK